MKVYDITLPMGETLAVWPGDTPYHFELTWKMSAGEAVNVGAVTMSAHTGTHADAPFHFLPDGAAIDAIDPAVYIGAAVVIDARGKSFLRREDIPERLLALAPRVLLRTDAWNDHARFPDSIPVMEADVPAYLSAQGVVLIGLDVPSVDALDSKDLPNHHALAARGIHILESLNLTDVPEGTYELIALPLRMVGADGSPVRAILRA